VKLSVDFHSHLIPSVDDGARGAIETVAMARGLQELGVKRVHLTPHQYRMGNAFTVNDLRAMTDDVWRVTARAGVQIEFVRGAEYFYGEQLMDAITGGEELITFEHDGETCVLIELPLRGPAIGVRRIGEALVRRSIRPVMAHPERGEALDGNEERVEKWWDAGWRFQLNLMSLVGRYGPGAQRRATEFLESDLYDFAGSDLHHPTDIPVLQEAHEVMKNMEVLS